MNLAGREADHRGEVPPPRQARVPFDGRRVAAELGPREEWPAKIAGGGVQRAGGWLGFDAERFVGIERRGRLDQDAGEVGKEAPVALLVGAGQRAAGGRLTDAAVRELGADGAQAGFEVAQARAPGQLGEGHAEARFVRRPRAHVMIAVVTADALVEVVVGQARP